MNTMVISDGQSTPTGLANTRGKSGNTGFQAALESAPSRTCVVPPAARPHQIRSITMDQTPGWKPYYHEYEYPDQAGYPDGVGTLDEGTAMLSVEDEIWSFIDDIG